MSLGIFFFKSDSTATTSIYMVYKYMFYSIFFFLGNCRLVGIQAKNFIKQSLCLEDTCEWGEGGLEKK